ncbi:MAG TPA: hypothetical protein VND20_04840 [Candidatus Binataceae bacterium]|nr:hypothetical protein [Candidatus Binataceae bacterium]
MSLQIGEAGDRRHTAPIASVTLWAALCGAVVVVIHAATRGLPARLGSYRTGVIVIAVFALASIYSARKHSLWLSVRWLRLAMRLPRRLARRMVLFDRLETWRTIHITVGVLALLPLWWHLDAGPASRLDRALELVVAMVVLSGLFGTMIQDRLPHATRLRPDQEVRIEDVEANFHQLYFEAEESILGHSEDLVRTYLAQVRPILTGKQGPARMWWATITGGDPAPAAVRRARRAGATLGADRALYEGLIAIAERKVRLEHNRFDLILSNAWLTFHIALVVAMAVMVAFHVSGALYFGGL